LEKICKFVVKIRNMGKTAMTSTRKNINLSLGAYQFRIDKALDELHAQNVIRRIWQHDHTVWKPDQTEINNRLGWLDCPETMKANIREIDAFVHEVRAGGFTHALLLGMGGSSLAPEVFRLTFGVKEGYLDLAVLDSTDPGAVLAFERNHDLSKTLFIVSSKSGGTVETLSFFKYFFNRVAETVGDQNAGRYFVAITDPGSSLETTANQLDFRKIFLNDPDVGGRFSALTCFGLVPAALTGIEVAGLLENAGEMAQRCRNETLSENENTGAFLGVMMGKMAKLRRDKVTLVASPPIASLGVWVEQLVAESTGKENRGILPVATEPVSRPEVYADDRLFVYLRLENDTTFDVPVQALRQAGQPVVQLNLHDKYDLGGEMFRWEFATAVACWQLGVNPFDQPDVESAKVQAQKMMAEYQKKGALPQPKPKFRDNGITVYTDLAAENLVETFRDFIIPVENKRDKLLREYVALQAFIQPSAESDIALHRFATMIRNKYRLATTYGYGPRFLHSTGQLHKGDAGNGLFIQITASMLEDAAIPDKAGETKSSSTFGVLKMAQALGDHQALRDAGRQVIRFDLGDDVVRGLKRLEGLV
jgi:glucose-6-phosphate isomerase